MRYCAASYIACLGCHEGSHAKLTVEAATTARDAFVQSLASAQLQPTRGRFGIRVKLVTGSSDPMSDVCPRRFALSDAPYAPAIPLKTNRSLDTGSRTFSGRPSQLLARAAEHIGLDRLASLHQSIDSNRFLDQPIPCDRVLHVSRTYPRLDSTRTSRKKPGRQATQRWPSNASPPPGTMQCRWGWCCKV